MARAARHAPPVRSSSRPNAPPAVGRPWKKWVLNVVVLMHLLAVVAEPFRFFSRSQRGTSPAADPIRLALAPYVEFAYLNHGYFFFAPEPGPSHLIEARLQVKDQREVTLTFPNRGAQWPRLLYHRHFMLAEFLHQLHAPPFDPELAAGDPLLARDWQADRTRFELVRDSMRNHLQHRFDVHSVEITRLEHRLPSSGEVLRDRLRLDDPSLLIPLPDAPFERPLPPGLEPSGPPAAVGTPWQSFQAPEQATGEEIPAAPESLPLQVEEATP